MTEAQVKVNGHLSRTFLLERGVRQGCPLSMILYIIFAEVLLENIRQNHNIKGIKIGQKEIKISAFADDTMVYIGDNKAPEHLQKQFSQMHRLMVRLQQRKHLQTNGFPMDFSKNKTPRLHL